MLIGRARTYMYRCHRVDAQDRRSHCRRARRSSRHTFKYIVLGEIESFARDSRTMLRARECRLRTVVPGVFKQSAVSSTLISSIERSTKTTRTDSGNTSTLRSSSARTCERGFIEGIVVARDHGIGPFDVVGRIHNRNDIVTPRRAPQSRVTLVGHEPRQPREQPCIVAKLSHLDLRMQISATYQRC